MAKKGDDAAAAGPKDPTKKLRKLVKGAGVVMLTTVGPDGRLRSRPMIPGDLRDGALLFLTRVPTAKTTDVADQQRVHLSSVTAKGGRYASISGVASILRDAELVKELWGKEHKSWFPEGKKDPELAVLRVQIDQADVWDKKAKAMVPVLQPAPAPAPPATTTGGGSRRGDKAAKEDKEQPVGPGALG